MQHHRFLKTAVIEGLFLFAVGCSSKIEQPPIVALHSDNGLAEGPGHDAGHVVPKPECVGGCCPPASECYPPATSDPHSGPECLAQRENTGQKHWQFRQTLSVSSNPPGIAVSAIANLLAQRSELNWPACNAPIGTSGFIQLIDIDTVENTARVGFARYVDDAKTALSQGLCFVEDTYDDPKWVLPQVAPAQKWPAGLEPPLSLPFQVKPVIAVRYTDANGNFVDFDLKNEREDILKRLDPKSGDLKKYGGIYFLDEKAGVMHGYAPVVYILNYDTKTQYNAIPIRESEIRTQLNDPSHPNCAGVYLGNNPNLDCTGDGTTRSWGCAPGSCGGQAAGPTTVEGYFLITELEQIHNGLLDRSLCYVFPGPDLYPGWTLTNSCRSDAAHWDLQNPLKGVPPGDWCAATNTKADEKCHDAWRSVSSATFQAFPIQEATCAAK